MADGTIWFPSRLPAFGRASVGRWGRPAVRPPRRPPGNAGNRPPARRAALPGTPSPSPNLPGRRGCRGLGPLHAVQRPRVLWLQRGRLRRDGRDRLRRGAVVGAGTRAGPVGNQRQAGRDADADADGALSADCRRLNRYRGDGAGARRVPGSAVGLLAPVPGRLPIGAGPVTAPVRSCLVRRSNILPLRHPARSSLHLLPRCQLHRQH